MELQRRVGVALTITIRVLFFILMVLIGINLYIILDIPIPDKDSISSMATVFLSIILEALPFILLGSLAASLIQTFISDEWIARVIPQNRVLGILFAGFMGFLIPVCECAIIPVVRSLMKKGVPAGIAVTFMLSAPIVNPVVMASTYYAFGGSFKMMLLRAGTGLAGAFIIGVIIDSIYAKISPLKLSIGHSHHNHSHSSCGCEHGHVCHSHNHNHLKLIQIIEHATEEFYDVAKYLILGAFISTMLQSVLPRQQLLSAGGRGVLSIAAMMSFAYVVSLCSEADAFIASTFTGQLSTGAIIAFLVLGPMIDIKNTLMLKSSFKNGFSALLMILIFAVCFVSAAVLNLIIV